MVPNSDIDRRARTLVAIAALAVLSLLPGLAAAQGNGKLQIHYLNVGQGDAAVLISPLGETVMFDDGPGNCANLVSYLQAQGINHLDYHIASHYHDDHIGCAPQLLAALPLQQIALDRGGSYSTIAYSNYVTAVGAKRRTATVGTTVTLDATSLSPVVIQVVALNGAGTGATDENDLSLVAVVRFGNFHATFGGDLSGISEGPVYPPPPDPTPPPPGATARCNDGWWSYSQNRSGTCSSHLGVWYWVCPGLLCTTTPTPGRTDVETPIAPLVGRVEVYKVHHHGSRYSSNLTFLNTTMPKVGVISVGAGNSYGHPTADALARLHMAGVRTYWTSVGAGVAPIPGLDVVGGTIVVQMDAGATFFTVNGGPYDTWETVVPPPTNPTAVGNASPASVSGGGSTLLTVGVAPGSFPTSTGITVTGNLANIGGLVAQSFYDDGTHGDVAPGDRVYSFLASVPDGLGVGSKSLPVTAVDAQHRSANATINLLVQPALDSDGDGLPDPWETRFGLDPNSAVGDNGAASDPDHDGTPNLVEFLAGTHPRSFFTRYFAEGSANDFFDCYFAVANPGITAANVLFRFLRDDGVTVSQYVNVPATSRRTVSAKDVPRLAPVGGFSTVVESDVEVAVDRTMTWDATGYGSHAETAVLTPATTWYLAEGATHSGFDLYYLIENPNDIPVDVQITYLRPAPLAPIVLTYPGIAPHSRKTIYVNGEHPGLAAVDVSGVVTSLTSGGLIIVERAMYLNGRGRFFRTGHDSAGVTAPATDWFLAEGATGFFDLYVLVANPNLSPAHLTLTYLLPDGTTASRPLTIAPSSRSTVYVNWEAPNGISLANTAVSTKVHSDLPVLVERAMWWPAGGPDVWEEAHNSPGTTSTGTRWALADGEQGGARNTDTYVLIANTSPFAGTARVTALLEDGTTLARDVAVPANSRTTLYMGNSPDPQVSPFGTLLVNKRFGTLIESLSGASGTPEVVVERAMYSNANGVWWAAGTDLVATRLGGLAASGQAQVTSSCLRPFAIPDKWIENQTPPWDPSDTFDPSALPIPDVYSPASTGYRQSDDQGRFLALGMASPSDAPAGGWFLPLDLPSSGGYQTGGDRYRANVAGCNGVPTAVGDQLVVEPGNMIGPTAQGIQELIASDPAATWDPGAHDGRGGVVNSPYGDHTPRIVAIPIYDPYLYEMARLSGRTQISVVRFVGFFVEGLDANRVVGRFTGWSTLSVSNATAATGAFVTLTASMVGPGSPLSSVPIEFSVDGSVVGTAKTDDTGTATLAHIDVRGKQPGIYPVQVRLAPDAGFFIADPASAELRIVELQPLVVRVPGL